MRFNTKIVIGLLLCVCASLASAQTCVPGNGVTCTPNLNLWLPPFNYPVWNQPMNANFNILDGLAANTVRTNVTTPQTMTGQLILPSLIDSELGNTTSPVCPNGAGGALTTVGCTSPSGFSIRLGATVIPALSTTTLIDSLTLTNATVNGVLLSSTGSSSLFLTQAGTYAVAGAGSVTEVDTGAGLTGGPIFSVGTISIPNAGVTNAMLLNSTITVNGIVCTLGSPCTAPATLAGGALGSLPYQSAADTTAFVAGATTSGHTFVLAEQPSGSLIAPTLLDLGTYLGTNVTASSPIVATPSTLGTVISCPTCTTSSIGTSVSVNGGSALGTMNLNLSSPVADLNFLALTPKISGADVIIEAPYGSAAAFGVLQCGSGLSCSGGVATTTSSISGMATGQVAIAGTASTITSSIALGNTGSNIPQLSGGLLNSSVIPNNAANTTGFAAGVAGGALGSVPYQSAANTTTFVASPTTSGSAFVLMWTPAGSPIAPTAVDLGSYISTNVTATSPITATPTTLGTVISCPSCTTTSSGTDVTVNGGSVLGSININALSPVADAGFFALTPSISGGDMIIEAPLGDGSTFGVIKCSTGLSCTGGVATTTSSISGATSGQVLIAGSATTATSSIALGNSGSNIPQLSSGLLNASVIPNNAANTTGFAAGIAGGALGSLPYQSVANTTVFIAGPTTNGHAFVPMWQPTGSVIAPTAQDLGTYLGTNIAAAGPITVTPTTLGVSIDCPTCSSGGAGTNVSVNGGSSLGSANFNATAPVADANFLALTPKISGASIIIEAPFGTAGAPGVLQCGTGLSCSGGIASTTASLSGMTSGQVAIAGSATTVTSSIALGNSGSNIPQLSGGLLNASVIPNNAANTTGNAASLAAGALGSVPYQTAVGVTGFVAGVTTSGHTFVLAERPTGSLIAPVLMDLGTYLGTNVTGSNPIVVTATTLGVSITCPSCRSGGASSVSVNGGSVLSSLNINATSPVADANFFALTPKISSSNMIIESPFGSASTFGVLKCGTGTSCASGVITTTASLSGMTTGQLAIAGSATTITSSIAIGNTGSSIPQLSGGLLNASVIPNNAANTTGSAASITGGALGSLPYQSAASTTSFLAGVTTSGHTFVLAERPTGSLIAPTLMDLGTYLGTNVTASSPLVATPTTLGVSFSCPTCNGGGTAVTVNGGGALSSLNINATAPIPDANFAALTPKISGASMIVEAPFGSASVFGVLECGSGTTCTGGVISASGGLSGMTIGQLAVAGGATTITSSVAIGNTGSSIPQLSSGLLNASVIPNNAANTSGTAGNLSGTPLLPNGTTAITQAPGDNTTKIATDAFVIANVGSVSGLVAGQVAIAGGASSITSSIALGNTGSNIPQLSGGLLASSVIPNNTANTTGSAGAIAGGALGSVLYQSAANTTAFVASPVTSGHTFFLGWQPIGSIIAPASIDLGTFIGSNVTASAPIVATPSTLGTQISCPTCGTAGGGTSVGINGGSTLGSLNINAISPVADANFLALTPKITAANLIIEAPFGSSSGFGVLKCGTGTTCTAGVISATALSFANITAGTNPNALLVSGSLGPSGAGTITATSMPYSGLSGTVPTWNQNTTGTAANLSGTPALPNGTTATTQAFGDNTTRLATDAFVQANSTHTICSGTITLPTSAIPSGSFALATPATCTGLTSTDNIVMDFNGSPLGVFGYAPSASGIVLTIYKWPSTNTINVAVGNSTNAPQTPAAATVNYHVFR